MVQIGGNSVINSRMRRPCKWTKPSGEIQQDFWVSWIWVYKKNFLLYNSSTLNKQLSYDISHELKRETENLPFVPFSFYLSCAFKIGYFNLGVFPATID